MSTARILVVRGGAIGDFIMTLPAIGALRERWPDAHIEILGSPHITELSRGRHYAQATRSIDSKPLSGFFVPNNILEPALMDYFAGFDIILSYLYDPDGVFGGNVRRCGVRHLIEGSPRPTGLHAAAHYCKPLESLAIYVDSPQPRIYPSEADRGFAAEFFAGIPAGRIVAVHPGSGSAPKNWPAENFAALCKWLASDARRGVTEFVIVQGEADEDEARRLIELLRPLPVRIARGLKLPELAGVLECCALYLGNDSGITHLAAAVGAPTVAMIGPASASIWEPRGERVRVVRFGAEDIALGQQAIESLLRA